MHLALVMSNQQSFKRNRKGATSVKDTSIILRHGRKQPRRQSQSGIGIERFFDTLHREASWCCFGAAEAFKELERYNVDELFVADSLRIADRDSNEWKELATKYKVTRFHLVSSETPEGHRFCKDFRIAGLLCRQADLDEDWSPAYSCVISTIEFGSNSTERHTPKEEFLDSSHSTFGNDGASHSLGYPTPLIDTPKDTFLMWLSGALSSEMLENQDDALALFEGVELILFGDATYDSWNERMTLAISVLSDEAPMCATELTVRWYSAQLAETTSEHTIVVEGKFRDLPAGAFSLANAECTPLHTSADLVCSPKLFEAQDCTVVKSDLLNAMTDVLIASISRTSSSPSYDATMTSTRCLMHNEPGAIRRAISFPLCF